MARLARSARGQATLVACVLLLAASPALGQGGADGAAFVEALQARAGALRLSDVQKQQLGLLRIDAQIEAAPLVAERRVLALKLRRQQLADPAQVAAAGPSAARLEQLDAGIARAERETARKALTILSAKQRALVAADDVPAAAPSAATAAAAAPATPEGRDAKLVEFETSDAIAERLLKWAQWLAIAVGLPLAILAAVLATLGVRSYADFRASVDKAREGIDTDLKIEREKVDGELKAARKAVEQQMQDAAGLQTELVALRTRLGEVSELESSVRDIAAKVTRIEQFVGFEKSTALTPKLQASLEAALTRYRQWLLGIGMKPGKPVTVHIDPKTRDNAYYMAPNKMVIAKALAGDPDVLLREYSHHVLIEGRPGRKREEFTSIQSGLADYLPCSFNGGPLFAVKAAPVFNRLFKEDLFPNGYVRRMDNDIPLDLGQTTVAKQPMGEAWGGAFWEIRSLLGAGAADPLLLEAWKTSPSIDDTPAGWTAFIGAVIAGAQARHPKEVAKVRAIFAKRWPDLPRRRA
jgi:hypothetical protein